MRFEGAADILLEPVAGRLGVARTSGSVSGTAAGSVAWVLVEGGAGRLHLNGESREVAGRDDVFSETGWSAVIDRGDSFRLDGDNVRATVVWRPVDAARSLGGSRIVDPSAVAEEERGSGATARRVRTYVDAGPIIAGETLNPPGGWSSYPPHRHEHEEVYVYRFTPPGGFGVAVEYEEDRREARVVTDGSVQRIASGYHPVVAAPGYTMYYLWALAGSSDTLTPEFDPAHAGIA